MLNIIHDIPEELITCELKDINNVLSGPTLLHIKGKIKSPLIISTLLHGNETTSFYVLQKLLEDFKENIPQRDVILFIGNIEAASLGLRQVKGKVDYNRIWKKGESAENKMAMDVIDYVKELKPFANIDIHNNTGANPFYACINKIENSFLQLASLFSKRVVYFTEPSEVQSMAFSNICPSVTIEAGQSGQDNSVEEVYTFIQNVLKQNSLCLDSSSKGLTVFHTVARIKIDKFAKVDFHFENGSSDISFISDIESLNFKLISPGTKFALESNKVFKIVDNNQNDITDIFFRTQDKQLITAQGFIPSMLTKDIDIIKSDCLGYIMEKILSI